jgi:hypothetical protein
MLTEGQTASHTCVHFVDVHGMRLTTAYTVLSLIPCCANSIEEASALEAGGGVLLCIIHG